MLKKICINGFKCFDKLTLPLNKITLLTGANSSGKSTLIQALLLMIHNANTTLSPLNGMWLNLGTFDECRNHITNTREFSISLCADSEKFKLKFTPKDESGDIAQVKIEKDSELIRKLFLTENKHIYYIPADRQGIADSYKKNFDIANPLGSHGEFIIDFLFKNKNTIIQESLLVPEVGQTLLEQTNYWLNVFFKTTINIIENKLSNNYSVEYKKGTNKPLRPYHIGSGISYSLGLIVSCLAAQKDDVIILENPEIHLHPKAQAELTEFLCKVAKTGVQIIIETHSDHTFQFNIFS